ncbi:MAG: DsbA family protein [Anaerolineaceae bacterium]|jgi:protein-disulfide isomerase|nr:MAG: DsbA family protein [Anaerolineaceae bacterium]
MDTPAHTEDTITFKRTHFYSVLVVLAFAIGILTGYVVWGLAPRSQQSVANNPSVAQGPVVEAPAATQSPQFTRYDIPFEGFPSQGPVDAPIVIVEFSDFQCPFCKRFQDETAEQLLAAYPDQIRFVYRHLPLTSIHPEAFPSAEASMCANEQNAFWVYHDRIFESQDSLGRELYMQIAADLNLDTDTFEECLNSGKFMDAIQQDMEFALNLGVQSTPTFFINGLAIVGAQPLEAFKQIIDLELAGKIP